jgi:hypothetical protein
LTIQQLNHAKEFEMKKSILFSILLLALALSAAVASYTSSAQRRDGASLAGVWKGNFSVAPAVEITLNARAGQLAGKALFYQVINSGAGEEIKGKVEAPLVDPVFDGQHLSFRVKREDGSFYKGRIEFVAEHEAILYSQDRHTGEERKLPLRKAR